jgi:hypothetical protein
MILIPQFNSIKIDAIGSVDISQDKDLIEDLVAERIDHMEDMAKICLKPHCVLLSRIESSDKSSLFSGGIVEVDVESLWMV